MSVSVLIHLPKQSRHVCAKIGQFFRPDKPPCPEAADLHLWLGRPLTAQEFNVEFPQAVNRMQGTLPVLAKLIEQTSPEESAPVGDGISREALDQIEALKKQHAEEIARIQEGVNEFTAQHNATVQRLEEENASLRAQIEQLSAAGADKAPEALVEETAPAVGEPQEAVPSTARKKKK